VSVPRLLRSTKVALLASVQLLGLCALGAPAAVAGTVSPLPESDYTVARACRLPAPGHAGCLALELRARTAAAKALQRPIGMTRRSAMTSPTALDGAFGLSPEDLKDAYFPGEKPEIPDTDETQTIALIDAYNDYHAKADLNIYDQQFGLPELGTAEPTKCSTTGKESGCFEQVNQHGETTDLPFPSGEQQEKSAEAVCVDKHAGESSEEEEARVEACAALSEAEGWSVEISTDIEMARAVCQNCKILLVEAKSSEDGDLMEAEQAAFAHGATEVSNSWGGEEPIERSHESADIQAATEAFEDPTAVVTASAGDDGYLNWTEREEAEVAREHGEQTAYFKGADYPASAPDVVAVGGTKLTISGGVREKESVWNEDPDPEDGNEGAGGGGCSTYFAAPAWQQKVADWGSVGCQGKRAVADIAADADPYTGVAVYDSEIDCDYGSNGVLVAVHWCPIGGTSVASPIIASMFALAGGGGGAAHPAETLYSHLETTVLHTVTSGGNGECRDDYLSCKGSLDPSSLLYPLDCGEGKLICNAAEGCGENYYSGPTGVGTPNGIAALEPGPETSITSPECKASGKSAGVEGPDETHSTQEPPPGDESGGTVNGGSTGASQTGEQPTGISSTNPSKAAGVAARLRSLVLTHTALAIARRGTLIEDRLAIVFKLSASAKLHLTLEKQVMVDGHKRWRVVSGSFFLAKQGRSTRSLSAHRKLLAGRYRLTLSIAHGGSRSIVFAVG
jgi:hypothetical protein